ncbi:MAG TPA: DUF6496 domain-containing protein [Puia sp.]|nr:DUF6496 domain-containing protein [Puia sp.]
MAKYGQTSKDKVEKALHEEKRGELKSGRSGVTVKSRRQAIAIGLSEARKAGGKVPPKKAASKKSAAGKKSPARKKAAPPRKKAAPARKRATPRKKAAPKKRSARKR